MPRSLLASTALIALAATGARAEDITTKVTSPLHTSTVKNGAADTITITKDGSVVLASGTGVTMDSNHKVANAGTISVTNANGATGIAAAAGTTGDIVNSGSITVDEPYTATDDDKDGDLDGPYALGSDRYGIRTMGDHTGNIVNSGTIAVEGNSSAGISLGGKLTGDFIHDGKTGIVGDNSVAIEAGEIDGNVRLAGTVTALGENAVGAHFGGDISGALVVQGSITSSGYRYTTPPADPSKLDADDLLQGGSALVIEGNVDGGIVLAVPPADSNPNNADEDADGIEDVKEGTARVVSYGEAPAMVIGAADEAITIGAVAGTASGYGLQIAGSVEGHGLYEGIDGNGLVIGGRGGDVTIANGIGISGTVKASSKGGNATAISIGSGASTPELKITGSISAAGGGTATSSSTAISVAEGADLPAIYNSGVIEAKASGEDGSATAIIDESGTVGLIENSGAIIATGAKPDSGRNVAIDLSANADGVIIRQKAVGAGFTAPSITGDIRLGAGDDLLDIADGTMQGTVTFGAGDNRLALSGDAMQSGKVIFGAGADTMTLAGTSFFDGTVDFGGGADSLTLDGSAWFSGSLLNASNAAVAVNGGILDVKTPTNLGSLDVGADGTLLATLSKAEGAGSAYTVAGNANFADGATLAIRLADVETAVGSYTVLTAGSITGLEDLETNTSLVPFMFKADLDEDAAANTIVVDVARRTTAEMGLNRSQSLAYDAVFAALSNDQDIEDVFLGITDGDVFRASVDQMLPDHAGGSFEGISLGVRTMARQMLDPKNPLDTGDNRVSVTANLAFWGSDKDAGNSAPYDLHGYGWGVTGEYATGIGRFGASLAYLWNQHTIGNRSNIKSDAYEAAAHWRGRWGTIGGFARASIGRADFDSSRDFVGAIATGPVNHTIKGDWNGDFVTFAAGASGEGGSTHFFYRPAVSIDYVRLKEDGYAETGGGEALDLTVESRKSDEIGLNGGLTLGFDLSGMRARDENWLRIETEGGYRAILSGGLGSTTAHFKDGENFTLTGEDGTSGWFARLRAFGGSEGFVLGGELSAEDRRGHVDLALRGSVSVDW